MKQPWFKKLAYWCKLRGKYVVILDRESKEPYLERYYLHPRWMTLGLFRVVIHKFWKSDDDRAVHSHPWLFWGTKLLEGNYEEKTTKTTKRISANNMFRMHSGWYHHSNNLS